MSRQLTPVKNLQNGEKVEGKGLPTARFQLPALALLLLALLLATGCHKSAENKGVRPNSLRDVPAERLAYSFTPDTDAPPVAQSSSEESKLKPIQDDFDTRRKDDRLLRTIISPDGQRALALYDTGETQEGEFRIDMYAADGRFLRNLTPPELSGAFAPAASWSPDGQLIAFIGRKSLAQPTPPEMIPEGAPVTSPTLAPAFAPVPVFDTEQVYVCDRDGFQLRPLTTRNGLIYFYLVWSPDSHALSALACRESEWDAREREHKLPAGRPRIIEMDGRERLLDDDLTEAGPVWSPDSSKVATGFEWELRIYDAVSQQTPTQAAIALRDPLLKASLAYDEKKLQAKNKGSETESGKGKEGSAPQGTGTPVSFNPIVRLDWTEDKSLFIQTAYVRIYAREPVNTFQRWHKVNLSMQAKPSA
jgi:Tol biopolymer transport system component